MEHQGYQGEQHTKRSRSCVPKICNGIAVVLLVAVIVLGGVGVGIPMWATLTPKRAAEDRIEHKVAVGMFDLALISVYPNCSQVSPMCRAAPAFRIATGDNTTNTMDVNIKGCWLMCNEKNKLEIIGVVATTEYVSQVQDRIRNATQDEVITDMTIAVTCRNFIAPRGMIIAGLSTAAFAMILLLIGIKFPAIGGLATCMCGCAFVVQAVGLILASIYAVRPCDRMNESWNYELGASFILVVISTALLLGVCILTTCSIIAHLISSGVQVASHMRDGRMVGGHHGDAEMGIGMSSSTDPLHRPHMAEMHGHHGPSQYVSINGVPHAGGHAGGHALGPRGGDIHMQMPSHPRSGSVGVPIPITTPSGMSMPNVPFGSAMQGLHGPGSIVTHTTHMEEHTITQQTADV